MKTPKLCSSLLVALLAVACNGAYAAGLGRISVFSALGQPLRAEVEISATAEELQGMSARVAAPQAFTRANIEYSGALTGVRMAIEPRAGGAAVLKISSDKPFSEPFVDMLVELNWTGGRLLREYTFLLDPSANAAPARPAVTPAQVASSEATPARATAPAAARRAAPAPAPAVVQESAKPAQERISSDEVAVKRGETASSIARAINDGSVSQEQMLAALYQANTKAFGGGNINRIAEGKILRVPSAEDAQKLSVRQSREIILKASNFDAYRSAVASAAASTEAEAGQAAGGKISSKVDDAKAGSAAGKDQLKITKTEAAVKGASDTPSSARLKGLQDDLVSREKALKESGSRVSELEKNVKELQKLIELKNQQLSELQKQASASQSASQVAQKKAEEDVKAAQVKAEQAAKDAAAAKLAQEAELAKAAEAAKAAEMAQAAEAAKVAEAAKAAKAAEAEQAAASTSSEPAAAVAPVMAEEQSVPAQAEPEAAPAQPAAEPVTEKSVLSSPLTWGALVLALLAAGFVVIRKRRRQPQTTGLTTSSMMADVTTSPNSVFGSTGGQTVDTGSSMIHTDFSQSGMSDIDADEGVDPVAEADVYMAYGRDAQAEEILLDALKSDPSRTAVYVKLLEIYAQRRSVKQFDGIATALYTHTSGVGDDWAKAAALGITIDPSNPLYRADGEQVVAAPAVADLPNEAQPQDVDPPLEMSFDLDVDEPVQAVEPVSFGSGSAPDDRATWTLPGDIDQLMAEDAPTSPQEAAALAASQAPIPDALNLDFNLDLELSGDEPETLVESRDEDVPAAAIKTSLALPSTGDGFSEEFPLEFDIDVGETTGSEAMPSSADLMAEIDAVETDTDLSMSDQDMGIELASAEQELAEVDLEKTNFEGNLLDFDFELGDDASAQALDRSLDLTASNPGAAPAPTATASASSVDLDMPLDDEPLGNIDLDDEISTKLDLARAYEEMGDMEGARELLEEVVNDGAEEQKNMAKAILSRIV